MRRDLSQKILVSSSTVLGYTLNLEYLSYFSCYTLAKTSLWYGRQRVYVYLFIRGSTYHICKCFLMNSHGIVIACTPLMVEAGGSIETANNLFLF